MKNRRGLRILLWIPCCFFLAQVLGGLFLDHVWMRPRYPTRIDMYTQLTSRAHPPEILFLGSSRFMGDVNCAVIDAELRARLGEHAPRCFNGGVPAGDPTVFERIYDDLHRRGYRPKLVVVEVDPGTLAGRDNWLYQHALNVLDWRDVPEAAQALVRNGRIMYLVRGRLLPLYLHNYQIRKDAAVALKSIFGDRVSKVVADPPVPSPVVDDPTPPTIPNLKALQELGYGVGVNEMKNYRVGGVVGSRLERLLARCQADGVAVLLVGVPVSSPQRRAATSEVNATFVGYMNSLATRYGGTFTDWREQIPDEYFCDNHHAFPEGGVYFSRRFAAKELAPYWHGRKYVR